MSGSDSEGESAAVSNPKTGRQMKVRLTEIGPRINIRLVKIEDGLCGGAVLWHAYKVIAINSFMQSQLLPCNKKLKLF